MSQRQRQESVDEEVARTSSPHLKASASSDHTLTAPGVPSPKPVVSGGAGLESMDADGPSHSSEFEVIEHDDIPADGNCVLCVTANQTFTRIGVGTIAGFHVTSVADGSLVAANRTLGGGVGQLALLFHTEIFAVVGGGRKAYAPSNRIGIFSGEFEMKQILCQDEVLGLRLAQDRVIAVLPLKVVVYDFRGNVLMDEAANNPRDPPIAVSFIEPNFNVAVCDSVPGAVKVLNWRLCTPVVRLQCHTSPLAHICLASDGERLVTASQRGTLLRVWAVPLPQPPAESAADTSTPTRPTSGGSVGAKDPATGLSVRKDTPLHEVRVNLVQHRLRGLGVFGRHIYSLGNSLKLFYLGSEEDSKPRYAGDPVREEKAKNQTSALSYFSSYMPTGYMPTVVSSYFETEWCCGQAALEELCPRIGPGDLVTSHIAEETAGRGRQGPVLSITVSNGVHLSQLLFDTTSAKVTSKRSVKLEEPAASSPTKSEVEAAEW